MKMIIDTSNKDLFISLIKNGKTISYKLIENLIKKADALPQCFLEVLGPYKTKQIKDFYITIGPGSFTGSRTALVFARSICQTTKANLHVTTSIQLIAGPVGSHKVYLDARSNKSYFGEVVDGKLKNPIQIIDFQETTKQSFDNLIRNPESYFSIFTKISKLLEIKPCYIKQPKIGG